MIFGVLGVLELCWPIVLIVFLLGPLFLKAWRCIVFSKEERIQIALGSTTKKDKKDYIW